MEPAVPFHGVIYPDGHPWDVGEIKALLGQEKFGALQKRSFKVEYFDAEFAAKKKDSISPCVDLTSVMSPALVRRMLQRGWGRTISRSAGLYLLK